MSRKSLAVRALFIIAPPPIYVLSRYYVSMWEEGWRKRRLTKRERSARYLYQFPWNYRPPLVRVSRFPSWWLGRKFFVDPFFAREPPPTRQPRAVSDDITKFPVLARRRNLSRPHPSFDFHHSHNRATSDPSYLSPFLFPGCHYSALGQRTLPERRAWWSQERRLARQKVPRKITYTSSSTALTHRISTFVIPPCIPCSHFIPGGTWQSNFSARR